MATEAHALLSPVEYIFTNYFVFIYDRDVKNNIILPLKHRILLLRVVVLRMREFSIGLQEEAVLCSYLA